MKLLGNGAYQLQKSGGANGYLVPSGGGFVLIDPGVSLSANAVIRELRAAELLAKVSHVLLTHYDYDHAGGAAAVARAADAPVLIGRADAEVLRGQRPPGTRFRALLTAVGRPKLPADTVLLDGESEAAAGIRAVPTAGHTPGHYAYVWGGTVFSGDAVMLGRDGRLKQFPGFLITDKRAALESTAVLAALGPEWICPGHGSVRKVSAARSG